jgi:hypothetical protein
MKADKFLKHIGMILLFYVCFIFIYILLELEAKMFFIEIANSKNFDPLDAEKWYSITRQDILQAVPSSYLSICLCLCVDLLGWQVCDQTLW